MPKPQAIDWSDDNEARHVAKHGVPFGFAGRVFDDPRRIEAEDLRPNEYGERRWNTVGVVAGICINVTYALQYEDTATIISARLASRKERKSYGYEKP